MSQLMWSWITGEYLTMSIIFGLVGFIGLEYGKGRDGFSLFMLPALFSLPALVLWVVNTTESFTAFLFGL